MMFPFVLWQFSVCGRALFFGFVKIEWRYVGAVNKVRGEEGRFFL